MISEKERGILEAAKQSFTTFGYKATTIDQITRLAGVGKGTLYLFFKNKEELFQSILDQEITQLKAIAKEALAVEESLEQRLYRALLRIFDYRQDHQFLLKMTQEVREMGTPAAKEATRQIENAIVSFIKGEIEQGIESGEIKNCPPELTAFVMLELYVTLVFRWAEQHEALEREQVAEFFDLYLMSGLRQAQ